MLNASLQFIDAWHMPLYSNWNGLHTLAFCTRKFSNFHFVQHFLLRTISCNFLSGTFIPSWSQIFWNVLFNIVATVFESIEYCRHIDTDSINFSIIFGCCYQSHSQFPFANFPKHYIYDNLFSCKGGINTKNFNENVKFFFPVFTSFCRFLSYRYHYILCYFAGRR